MRRTPLWRIRKTKHLLVLREPFMCNTFPFGSANHGRDAGKKARSFAVAVERRAHLASAVSFIPMHLPPIAKIGRYVLETCYLSATEFPDLAQVPLKRGSLFATLEREYGVALAYADEEIDATDADQRTAELLSVARNSPSSASAS
jgi:UTRA domain